MTGQLQREIRRLKQELAEKDAFIKEQTETLSHFKKIYGQSSIVAQIGIWECALPSEELTWSDYTYDLFELPRGTHLDRGHTLTCYTDASRSELQKRRSAAIAARSGFTLEAEIITFGGKRRWIRITASVECQGDTPVRIFGMKQDITDQKLLFDRIMYLAEHDQMTGLANKSQFLLKLATAIQRNFDTPGHEYLLLIDLDGFKPINDEYGHIAGDECLKEISNRLKSINYSDYEIFRIGGDEFAIIATKIEDADAIQKFAQSIINCMAEPVVFEQKNLKLGASIGIARIIGDALSDIFVNADTALYAAKAAGKATYRYYSRDMGSCAARISL
ncbi:diguanylate cyclase domain-containing protein [Brucellaceae bacterium C25G]